MGDRLVDRWDSVLLDLDGVVYIGNEAVPGAVEALTEVLALETPLAYITNNAARSAGEVADHLARLGLLVTSADVVTSAQAAAGMAALRWPVGSMIWALGGPGIAESLAQRRFIPASGPDEGAVAIVTGYGPQLPWSTIMRGAVAIRDGLPWIACNTDATIPTPYGEAPGHGALVELLSSFSGVVPPVAGKPATPLIAEAVTRTGASQAVLIGDRLDTDIQGARAAGIDSVLVLTGVSGWAEVAAASADQRPDHVLVDLGGLLEPARHTVRDGAQWTCEGFSAGVRDGVITVSGVGSPNAWWRVASDAAWGTLDDTGVVCSLAADSVTP